MYNSTQEIVNVIFSFCPVDNNHWSRGIFHAIGQEGTRILSCGGVVGADEPLRMGSSSRSERGSGQRPEALRDFAISVIDSHQFLSCFQLGKMSMIGTFCCPQFLLSGTRVN